MPVDLVSSSTDWFLPVILGAAAIDSINPCAFSILFLTITFLLSMGKDRKFILRAGAVYVFGIFLVYTLIGVGFLNVMSFFDIPNGLAKLGAIVLIAYSVVGIVGEFFPNFPLKLKIPASSHNTLARVIHKASIPASFFLGILVGLFEFPCTGGPYLFVLGLLHDQGRFWQGFGYLVVYNLVFVAPLIVILLVSSHKMVLEKVDRLRRLETKRSRLFLLCILLIIALFIYSL